MTKQEYLAQIDAVIAKGPYQADWHSLAHHKTPDWFTQRKLGIFIHWGIYSVPAFGNEWYSRNMYDPSTPEFDFHVKNFGTQDQFGYKDFIPQFTGSRFDAEEWVSLFREAGARYVMPVCEHHDGFAMYDTDFNRWNAVDMGPCRDVAGELKAACERQDMVFCASTHRAEHYFFMNMGRTVKSDIDDPACADFYAPAFYCPELDGNTLHATTADTYTVPASEEWLEDWLVRTCELIDRYQPRILYFDWWIHNHSFKPWLKKLAAYYYNRAAEWGVEVTINYKHEAFPPTVATFDVERGALVGISPVPWQTDTAIGKLSWGYTTNNEYKNGRQIICDLIDIVSKNGNLLLNIGPRPDGSITEEETEVLKTLGRWMNVNGEGIYGTTFFSTFGEGEVNAEAGFFMDGEEKAFTPQDFRFTFKDGYLYAFQMKPDGQDISIRTLARHPRHDYLIESVELLGSDAALTYTRDEQALHIHLSNAPETDLPLCFKIALS